MVTEVGSSIVDTIGTLAVPTFAQSDTAFLLWQHTTVHGRVQEIIGLAPSVPLRRLNVTTRKPLHPLLADPTLWVKPWRSPSHPKTPSSESNLKIEAKDSVMRSFCCLRWSRGIQFLLQLLRVTITPHNSCTSNELYGHLSDPQR